MIKIVPRLWQEVYEAYLKPEGNFRRNGKYDK